MIKILITGTFWRQLKVRDENKAILSINGLKLDNKSAAAFGLNWPNFKVLTVMQTQFPEVRRPARNTHDMNDEYGEARAGVHEYYPDHCSAPLIIQINMLRLECLFQDTNISSALVYHV